MNKNRWLWISFFVLLTAGACKQKKEEQKKYISVLSLIKEQVAQVDTSLFPIRKIISTDSAHSDTTYLKREDFRVAAADFLSIPDLSDKKVAKRYTEEPAIYDQTLNRVIISYKPVKPDEEEVKKQEILVIPNTGTGDKVMAVIISRVISNRNGFLEKEMLWQMDQSFQVVTTRRQPGEPEKISTLKVTWNEDTNQ